MKRSTDRILTTHAGRLNGPKELTEATQKLQRGESSDYESIVPLIRDSMAGVIDQQADAGIDVVSDGELGKVGFGLSYYGKRLTGLSTRPVREGEAASMSGATNERIEFAEFYEQLRFGGGGAGGPRQTQRVICNGPITYIGQDLVKLPKIVGEFMFYPLVWLYRRHNSRPDQPADEIPTAADLANRES